MTAAPPTSELAAFIEARLSEDEAAASFGMGGPMGDFYDAPERTFGMCSPDDLGPNYLTIDPARVLAQVAALRTILRFHDDENGHDCPYLDDDGDVCTNHFVMPGETCDTLLALAAIWADNEAFDPAWSA